MARQENDTRGGTATGRLRQLAATTLTGLGQELVHLSYRREGRQWFLRLMIDKEGGISMDDCAVASEQISAVLEVEDMIPHSFVLEVSSPGLDRPLFSEKDYQRFAGRKVVIRTHKPVDGRRQFQGTLEGCHEHRVTLRLNEGAMVHLELADIASGRLEVDLNQELSRSAQVPEATRPAGPAGDKVQE